MSRVLIDSSLLIEYFKGNPKAVEIFENLKTSPVALLINPIVFSEVSYLFLRYSTKKSRFDFTPEVVKSSKIETLFVLLNSFGILDLTKEIVILAENIMVKYGLLPNDALILATCKFYGIKYLISLDGDFKEPCVKEGIELIESAEKLKLIE
ncbi:putative nucleic acid-binding protein, contains PIN domain [Archaeoglobus sulfaticallidus PM70-1]|uniref:Putative nucleic acid-binding protein, contains PIN domain n=1 Tax=Archaeoglobus sulfaticallidus PM70-1 TaxID=387631 RepID=N0BL35_9EURY|nr:type II toxin-antitoxin system VapC family toxin [Archaeoglobus sulfaticallidus]AGK61251.1 putative nucleic acid-binding protein, contains PIN domain [Archaeoglobus sulfaticallidus PM70-1]